MGFNSNLLKNILPVICVLITSISSYATPPTDALLKVRQMSKSPKKEDLNYFKYKYFINESEKIEFEFHKWKIYSDFIPRDSNFCTPNPVTLACDEGKGLYQLLSGYLKKNHDHPFKKELIQIQEKYYQYEAEHESIKLDEFISQYESAVYPKSKLSKIIVNNIRGNDKRTDGMVYANCVPSTEFQPGKCDLVKKHALITRVLNQALYVENLGKFDLKKKSQQTILRYLKELKALVKQDPSIDAELFPIYQGLDLNQQISEYEIKSRLKNQEEAANFNLDLKKSSEGLNSDCLTKNCSLQERITALEESGKTISKQQIDSILSLNNQNNEKSFFIPLSLTNEELITLATATSLGVIAFANDQAIMDTIQKNKTTQTKKIEDVGNFLGSPAMVPLVAGSYFVGMVFEDKRLKQVGLFTVGASMASALVTAAFKSTFQRSRPYEKEGAYNFFNAGEKSFFSGHAAEAFTIATVISELYKEDYPVVPYIAYGMASITAYARMHDEAHWASDVIFGAVAGHLITKLFISAMKGNEEGRSGLMIYPSFDPVTGTVMLMFNYQKPTDKREMRCARIQDQRQKIEACIAEVFEDARKK